MSKMDEWDKTANISNPHLSFVLQILIPVHQITKVNDKRAAEIETEINSRARTNFGGNPPGKAVAVGSVSECYALPKIIAKTPDEMAHAKIFSDTDVLSVWDINPFYEYDEKSSPKQKIVLETNDTHAGYCRIHINDPQSVLNNVDPAFAVSFNSKYYLSAKHQRDLLVQTFKLETLFAKIVQVDSSGPAVGIEDPTKRTLKMLMEQNPIQDRQELVPALPCRWPKVATEWRERCYKSEWLKHIDVEKLIADGCHVVPVSHRLNKHPDIEWRISFATTEVALARNIVTDDQRQCFIAFKLFRKILMKDMNLVSSYHCKTVFLYSCEQLQVSSWKSNMGACFLFMLDKLIFHVQEKNLPSFFIPNNNLFDHFSDQEFQNIMTILTNARLNPMKPFLDFTDSHVITGQSVVTSFRTISQTLVADMKNFGEHKSLTKSFPEFVFTATQMFNAVLFDNNSKEAAALLIDMYSFFETHFSELTISEFARSIILNWKLVIQATNVIERLLLFVDKFSDLLSLQGDLALLYSSASQNFPKGSKQHTETTIKANSVFENILQSGSHTHSTIDYANLLIRCGEIEKANEIIDQFLSQTSDIPMMNKYNRLTIQSLHPSIKHRVIDIVSDNPTYLMFPSVSLAYYLKLLCEHDVKSKKDITSLFRIHCDNSKNAWSYCLLGFSLEAIKEFDGAEKAFKNAESIHPYHPIAFIKSDVCHVQRLVEQGKEKEAVHYLLDKAEVKYSHVNIPMFFSSVALQLSSPLDSVKLFEEIVEIPDLINIDLVRGNMACMYHASSFLNAEERDIALAKAYSHFQTWLCSDNICGFATVVDFALFHCSQGNWADAISLLEYNLDKIDVISTNSYSLNELHTVDRYLGGDVEQDGKITLQSKALAYYLLSDCFLHTKNYERFKETVCEFEEFCKASKNASSLNLLGYIYMKTETWAKAEHCFCLAVQNSWLYTSAKRNIAICRSKMEYPRSHDILQKTYVPLCVIPELLGDFTLDVDAMHS